jgi:hypothetical protein
VNNDSRPGIAARRPLILSLLLEGNANAIETATSGGRRA